MGARAKKRQNKEGKKEDLETQTVRNDRQPGLCCGGFDVSPSVPVPVTLRGSHFVSVCIFFFFCSSLPLVLLSSFSSSSRLVLLSDLPEEKPTSRWKKKKKKNQAGRVLAWVLVRKWIMRPRPCFGLDSSHGQDISRVRPIRDPEKRKKKKESESKGGANMEEHKGDG